MDNVLSFTQEKGVYRATQLGVQFPDGTVVWGDPNNGNLVILSDLGDSYSSKGFWLDNQIPGRDTTYLFARYREQQQNHGNLDDPITIVRRTIRLSIGETDTTSLTSKEAAS